jgi:hypothetical protein
VTPIAVLGGTGPEGLGLAMRLSAAGEAVVLGSRALDRAREAAAKVRTVVPGGRIEAAENFDALRQCDRVVMAVPFEGLDPFLDASRLAGKLVVDVVVSLGFVGSICHVRPVPGAASVGELIKARAPEALVVSAFKNIAAGRLLTAPAPIEGDCLMCTDDAGARDEVTGWVRRIPNLRPIDAGPLAIARYLEGLTALQINLNRRHRTETAVTILGLPPPV